MLYLISFKMLKKTLYLFEKVSCSVNDRNELIKKLSITLKSIEVIFH